MGFHRLAALLAACLFAQAQPAASTWSRAKTTHFEVYSQAGAGTARAGLLWMEQLRAFFVQQTGLKLDAAAPVRLIAFRSAREYDPYRLRAASDAYYVGSDGRESIVMPSFGAAEFGVAAHEYAHSLLRDSGLKLPAWLSEGLAEIFSTVRIGERGSSIGGELLGRSQVLQRRSWLPLAQLLGRAESPPLEDRDTASVFYAESWALADMLMSSPEYAARFPGLVAVLASGQKSIEALPAVCGRPLDAISRDLHNWSEHHRSRPMPLAGVAIGADGVEVAAISPFASRLLLAGLLLDIGELARAEALYRELDREAPANADVPAALGAIALKRGDRDAARLEWKRAMDRGINDAPLCYRYAGLASLAGLPADEVRRAYERAIALRPEFDDARYALALLEKNAGEYEAAVVHLQGMWKVAAARAFSYWCAMADALTQLGRRDEAVAAAQQARKHASTPAERASAAELAYVAQTDIAARFVSDASGRNQLVMTRVPHDAPDLNPFVEPGDDVRRVEGALREIDCAAPVTRFLVETAAGPVVLAIPDLSHLQARNAPAEFTCGPQPSSPVTVVYAAASKQAPKADGVLRGIDFK
ncbi:MAG TPA: tetratricopeptide repeat protein [Bryobacteraceae bacterium]